jgi:hypothetical protein
MANAYKADSKESVALDLMNAIVSQEATNDVAQLKNLQQKPREYYLKLYSQCLAVTSGLNSEKALER